jgi:hypothetical protein
LKEHQEQVSSRKKEKEKERARGEGRKQLVTSKGEDQNLPWLLLSLLLHVVFCSEKLGGPWPHY